MSFVSPAVYYEFVVFFKVEAREEVSLDSVLNHTFLVREFFALSPLIASVH